MISSVLTTNRRTSSSHKPCIVSSKMSKLLDKLWAEFAAHYKLDQSGADHWLQQIKTNYGRENYYNVQYLTTKLEHFEHCRGVLSNPFSILLALIFQSYVYEKKLLSNLERNIDCFCDFAKQTGLDKDETLVDTVKTLINQQSTGNVDDDDEEQGEENAELDTEDYKEADKYYFMDINFCNLASDWEEYQVHAKQMRTEYGSMDEEAYTRLRRKVLQNLLLIPHIYATKLFRDKYETKARENIQKEIEELLN